MGLREFRATGRLRKPKLSSSRFSSQFLIALYLVLGNVLTQAGQLGDVKERRQ